MTPPKTLAHGAFRGRSEYSAGGVVERDGKLLLIKVENLKGERLWTFPKGHLEKGETPRAAALREVCEETGWTCRIVGPLTVAAYAFKREGVPVKKRVRWYRMEAVERTGEPDFKEIIKLKWVDAAEARRKLGYPLDLKLLALAERGMRAA